METRYRLNSRQSLASRGMLTFGVTETVAVQSAVFQIQRRRAAADTIPDGWTGEPVSVAQRMICRSRAAIVYAATSPICRTPSVPILWSSSPPLYSWRLAAYPQTNARGSSVRPELDRLIARVVTLSSIRELSPYLLTSLIVSYVSQ